MGVKVRPYIWESSNRPMFVRSVWLDNEGHRHVLLNQEAPKRRDVKSFRRVQTEQATSIEDSLQCIGIGEVGISGKEMHLGVEPMVQSDKSPSRKLERGMGKLRACRKMCEKSDISFVSLKHHLTRQKSSKKGKITEIGETNTNNEPNHKSEKPEITVSKEDETHKNQLTERVLQWLDKTGKFTSLNPIVKREKNPLLPEINVKSEEEESEATEKFEFAKKVMSAENILKPRVKTAAPLRRSESVHTLSLTFDDEDLVPNPYGISRCKSAAIRFGEFFPTTYRCSKKFLSLCSRKTSASSSAQSLNRVSPPLTSASTNNLTNLSELPETANNGITPNSIVISLNNLDLNKLEETTGNRNSQNISSGGMEINNNNPGTTGGGSSRRRKILRRKDTLIENQYKSIIQKHILETQCNTQIVKRQLHIFIPKLPKKDKEKQETDLLKTPPPLAQDTECDSCLSTVYSEANN